MEQFTISKKWVVMRVSKTDKKKEKKEKKLEIGFKGKVVDFSWF